MPLLSDITASLYLKLIGSPIETFAFTNAPLSSGTAIAAIISAYLTLFFLGSALSRKLETVRRSVLAVRASAPPATRVQTRESSSDCRPDAVTSAVTSGVTSGANCAANCVTNAAPRPRKNANDREDLPLAPPPTRSLSASPLPPDAVSTCKRDADEPISKQIHVMLPSPSPSPAPPLLVVPAPSSSSSSTSTSTSSSSSKPTSSADTISRDDIFKAFSSGLGGGVDWLIVAFFYTSHGNQRTLRRLFLVHNISLTIFSYVMLHAIMEQVLPQLRRYGIFYSICHRRCQTPTLQVFYYVTYLSKFYEFIDTAFLVAKGKKVDFLHWYHHSLTALLCFSQLAGNASVQWVPISMNLFVHVVMYSYYALTTLGYRVWWKKYITVLQIAQFVFDVIFCTYCCLVHVLSLLLIPPVSTAVQPYLPLLEAAAHIFLPFRGATCAGELYSAIFGCMVLYSYLILFVLFYRKTYEIRKPAAVDNKAKIEAPPAEAKVPKTCFSTACASAAVDNCVEMWTSLDPTACSIIKAKND